MGRRLLARQKGSDNMPVTQVSWFDCMKFLKRLNRLGEGKYRLPTEAEWEYAARAGTQRAFSWGDTIDCEKAMYGNNSLKYNVCQLYIQSIGVGIDQPAPVKTYPPNPWGLYDMHGNVWEWSQNVPRGGGFDTCSYGCRVEQLSYLYFEESCGRNTGFRVVCD